MKLTRLIAVALFCASMAAHAQMVTFYGSKVQDSSGNLLANGTITATPVNGNGTVISYRKGGGGQVIVTPVTANVTNGAFTMLLPDVAQTNPANVGFNVSIIDNTTGEQLLGSGYGDVQPSMTASYAVGWCSSSLSGCDFDLYIPQSPTLATITETGSTTNNYGSGQFVDIASFPGADLGAQLKAADQAYAGQRVLFAITQPGTISTTPTLSAQHSLAIYAPVTFATYIIPTTNNSVECYGGPQATITNGMSYTNPNPDGVNAFFYAPPGATEVEHLTVKGCTFNGYGADGGYIFGSDGPSQDVSILDNTAITASLYYQGGAPYSNPTLRLTVRGNTCDWTQSVQNGTAVCVNTNGGIQHSIISQDHFWAPYYAVEMYGQTSDGKQAAAFPSQAEIETSNVDDNLFEGNDVQNVFAGIWVSTAYHNTWVGNHATNCSDYCYGVEAGSHNTFQSNVAINGSFGQEYGGFGNAFLGNSAVGNKTGFFNTAATSNSVYDGNRYWDTGGVGVFLYEEATDDHVRITNNDVRDGVIAYALTYMSSQLIQGNTFSYDVTIPSSGFGSPGGEGCGINIGDFQDSTYAMAIGNTVITTVPQTQPAICAGLSQPNTAETVQLINDTLIGPWSTDITLNSSSTNVATRHNFELRGIEFASGVVTATAQYNAPVNVICKGGGKGGSASVSVTYSYNGTASQMACN